MAQKTGNLRRSLVCRENYINMIRWLQGIDKD